MMNFIHIPKTAGSSIASIINDDQCAHRQASAVPGPRFTFVRHPLDRLVSAYEFMRASPASKMRDIADCSFEEFMTRDHFCLRTQTWWMDAPIDFVGRFENLHDDFKQISDQPLPHIHKSTRRPWPEYFTSQSLRVAIDRYREDFDNLGYEVPNVT